MYPTVSALFAAIAAWLSTGTLALTTEEGPRIALLPLSPAAAAISIVAGAVVFAAVRAARTAAPVWLLILLFLPWLPLPVPAAFLIWSGPLRLAIWAAVLALLIARCVPLEHVAAAAGSRPRLAAGCLSLLIAGSSAVIAAPSVPGGDEPHYLVITQSLLRDGDLKIENNHLRGDYQEYFAGPLRPDYLRRGRDGEIYSIHAPGISAIVAPAFAAGGYHGVVVFLVLAAALGGALLWHVAWLASRSAQAAWFGWAAIVLGPTWIFHTFTVYPDGVGGTLALTGIWALLRAGEERETGAASPRPWLLHGVALAILPWLHTRFALIAGTLGALIVLRLAATKNPAAKAVAFLAVPAVSAFLWIGYFVAIYGTADPAAPYGTSREFSAAFIPGGLAGLLFDQRFGLFANAPVLVSALFGFGAMLTRRRSPRLAIELLFVLVTYLLTVTSYAMWWGGWSAPARFAASAVPLLAVPAAAAWAQFAGTFARAMLAGALGATAFISAALVTAGRGRLAFNTREAYALWLDWASPLADLGRGMPAWFRDQEPQFFRDIGVWIVALVAAAVLLRMLARQAWTQMSGRLPTVGILMFAAASMAALTITWTLHGLDGSTAAPAQLQFLRRLSTDSRVLALSLDPLSRLSPADAVGRIQIAPGARYASSGASGRRDRPLLALPAVPAGTYRIRPRTRGPGGVIMIGIGQDQFALRTETLSFPPPPIDITFPVDVRALIVRADEDAQRAVREIVVEPVETASPDARPAGMARRAVKYPTAAVFFLDERSFPEPEAFWVGGARDSEVVVQPDRPGGAIRLQLRNAPINNKVTVEAGAWKTTLDLGPGEERLVEIPVEPGRGAALLRFSSSAGFRPSAVEPGSRDERFLGVWVRLDQNLATPPK